MSNALQRWLNKYKMGDKVQIIPVSITTGDTVYKVKNTDVTSFQTGIVVGIYNYYIRVQFANFAECFSLCDDQEIIIV